MTRVADLAREWRQVAGLVDRDDVSWERVSNLSERALDLGEDLLRAPAADLGDVEIKLRWLAEQDLDPASYRNALLRVAGDLERLRAH